MSKLSEENKTNALYFLKSNQIEAEKILIELLNFESEQESNIEYNDIVEEIKRAVSQNFNIEKMVIGEDGFKEQIEFNPLMVLFLESLEYIATIATALRQHYYDDQKNNSTL